MILKFDQEKILVESYIINKENDLLHSPEFLSKYGGVKKEKIIEANILGSKLVRLEESIYGYQEVKQGDLTYLWLSYMPY